jgi:hypothetical protein
MATPRTSRALVPALLALALASAALAASGCGGASATPTSPAPGATAGGAFPVLRPSPPPAGWRGATLPSGAVLAYPASWRTLHGDAGTATAALRDAHGGFLGYLNLTPRQGRETLANWTAFRPAHNRAEGDTDVVLQGSARDVPFRGGARGSCVRDAYSTTTSGRFVEIACLVHGPRTDSVIVVAAPPAQWARQWPTLRRALEAVRG